MIKNNEIRKIRQKEERKKKEDADLEEADRRKEREIATYVVFFIRPERQLGRLSYTDVYFC